MTSKQTKRIAFLLAASLLMNTVALPVSAESDVVIVGEAPTEAPPTEAPVEIVTEAPTEAATEAPREEATEAPTAEATEAPTEETTEAPTEETTEVPTEETTEAPTEEPTEDPLTRESILAAQQEGYQQALSHFRSMDISDDRSMSLEWWCVMTGNVSMREPDYSILDAAEGTTQEEASEKTWADYIVFSEVISVRSASDLILLSYVSPSLYQNRTITLFADAGDEFDLVHPLAVTEARSLSYRGLGDLGTPFSGIIRYAENSENITFVLDAPLFIGLSTKAKFLNGLDQPNTVFLISKAGFAFDGLLARHVTGEQQDEANWFIQLNAPEFTGGAVYVLPSLLGILYGNANVNLLLTDNSYLSPSYRGYLCATMYAKSSLSAAGITRNLSVPLVGEVSPDATLITDAPQEEATEPTEEVTEPTEETTAPTEEVTEPTEEVTEPTEEVTEPTEEATEPTEEVTEPAEEETEPAEEVTEPTEEPTEPTTSIDRDALLAKQEEGYRQAVEYYRSMPISSERIMPLEWWYVMAGQATMRQPDYSVLETVNAAAEEPEAAEQEATEPVTTEPEVTELEATELEATEPETTEPVDEAEETETDWSAFLVFPKDITVNSATDLILLSYVTPNAYRERTITLAGEQGFDLSQSILQGEQWLTYQGLGDLNVPYSGVFCFNDSASFVLSAPLFVGLSTKAAFQNQLGEAVTITLVSKATPFVTSLMAAHVMGNAEDTGNWAVHLIDPENKTGGPYVLPSLFGAMYEAANVNLTLLDESTLTPSASGYLCATMYAGASLNAGNITRTISVPLVGVLSEGAALAASRTLFDADGVPIFYVDMTDDEFQALADYYANLTIVPGEMPLEWWFAFCGKLDDLRTYLTQKAEQQAAAQPVALPALPSAPVVADMPAVAAETETPALTGASVQDGVAMFAADGASSSPVFFAEEAPIAAADNTATDGSSDSDGTATFASVNLSISSADDLINLSLAAAAEYQTETITITASGGTINVSSTNFAGLGSADAPFSGKIEYSNASERASIVLSRALFNALSVNADISNVNLTWAGTVEQASGAAVLADTVRAGTGSQAWNVTLGAHSGDVADYRLPALVHTIEAGAAVTLRAVNESTFFFGGQGFFCDELKGTLTATYPDKLPTFNTAKDSVGGMVGTMDKDATLTVKGGDIVIDVATSGSTAGGLVGSMASGATLSVEATSITVNQVTAATADGSNVGTLVGEATNPIVTELPAEIAAAADHIGLTGYNVGGLVGKLTLDGQSAQPPVAGVTGLALKGVNCGGLYGVLSSSVSFAVPAIQALGHFDDDVFKPNITTSITATHVANGTGDVGSAGGVIGLYCPTSADTAPVTLQFTDASTNVTVNKDDNKFANVGGMIGSVQPTAGSEKSYVSLSGVSSLTQNDVPALHIGGFVGSLENAPVHLLVNGRVVSEKLDSEATGGLLGLADDNGHLVETGDDLTIAVTNLTGAIAGGLVGDMQSGTVYMHSVPNLDSTAIYYGQTHGWIVGKRGNALVCAAPAITDWPVGANRTAANDNNDTGVWGQVLQLNKFNADLVTLDSGNHTVTVRSLPAADDNGFTIGSLTDFAAVALRVQLNPMGMLVFDNDFADGAAVNLSLASDINLTNTGLTSLTRDCAVSETHSYSIQGNGYTVTLPNVTVFASPIGHNYQGLIAQCINSLTLNGLTVAGGSAIQCHDSTAVYSGIVAELKCPATISYCTSTIAWTVTGNASIQNNTGSYPSCVSGFIGMVNGKDDDEISFKDSTWNGTLKDDSSSNAKCIMGGFLGDSSKKQPEITFTDCTVSGKVENTNKKDGNTDAMVGGLFGRITTCGKFTVNGLTVKDETVTTTAARASGGLLGYALFCGDTTFSGVTIGNSTLTTDARFGGLIYKGSGHWRVQKTDSGDPGISFQSATVTGKTVDETPSGLLVSIGCNMEEASGLYLEVGYDAYKIQGNSVIVSFTTDFGTYFDELVGRSISEVSSGNNGIVSIATADEDGNRTKIDTNDCNTYQKQLTVDSNNPRTRYYYNLDSFLKNQARNQGQIDNAEKMVLWSAYNECSKTTNGWRFQVWSTKTISGTIDLTGYSFYPVAYDGTSIQNANITFAFKELEEAETNATNKKPSDTLRQHAGMHTGIFAGITTYNAVLNVNNLTLRGTVGGLDGKYGALVRGNIIGRLNTGDAKDVRDTVLNITGVTLDGISVYPAPNDNDGIVAPLLIFSIDNYVTMRLTDVKTTSSYVTQGISKAASSLIGKAGSGGNTTSIDLEFSKIQLTPPSNDADTDCKGNNCTLFTRALFLESFQYATGCRGVYNFKCDDNYTIGREVSNATSGRNQGKQYWFFDEWGSNKGYVCGEANTPADYYKDYTRYVAAKEAGETYKELDVNLQPLDLTDGCGTYSDPYRITSGGALQELAKALRDGGSNPSWKVNISTAVLPNSSDTPDFSKDDGHTQETAADGQELVLVCGEKGKDWSIAKDDTDAGDTTVRATEGQMLTYLRNAYYMITEDITLPSDWAGLGTTAAPFRGVIVGGGTSTPTVTVTSPTSSNQFGGLIRFSQGSVVKNLSIQYPDSFTLTSDSNNILNYDSAVFFGGVVGCCMAGDTVIDGVSVTLPKALTVTGKNANYAAIGGYVGLVGGANNLGGGGVVFRGSVSSSWQPNNNLYTNPYAGRVLDGYAVSETAIDNTNKNYTIPTLSSPSLTLDGTITVGNADGLWLLSAMENSRHGNAYSNGKPRTSGDYDNVGQSTKGGVSDESGSGTQTNYYLWKHYGINASLPTSFKLVFSGDCDMSAFGNGFRGIGVSQGTFRAYLRDATVYPLITEIDGGGHTVTLAQTRAEPTGQYVDWSAMGAGLFPVLNAGASLSVRSLTLAGTASLTVGDILTSSSHRTLTSDYQRTQVGVGMLAGALVSKRGTTAAVTLTSIHASGTVSTTAPLAGGLIGYCGSPVSTISNEVSAFSKLASISVTDCSVSGTVNGSTSIGGFIGFTYADTVTVSNCRSDGGITLGVRGPKDNGKLWNYGNWEYTNTLKACSSDGLGGIIGTASATTLQVDGVTLNGVTILANNGADGEVDTGFGGIVGTVSTTAGSSNWLKNITMTGTVSIQDMQGIHVSAGFLIGYLADTNFNGWNINDGSASSFEISNVNIGSDAGSAITLKGFQVGGLIGMLKDGKVALKIGGETVNADGTKTPLPVRIGNAAGKNGSISANNFSNAYNKPSLGGLIGIVCNMPTIDIQNLYLGGITVNKANFNSLILAKSTKANATITLKNTEIVSCSLTKTGDNETGFLLGSSNGDKTIYEGFNILLKDCTTDANGFFAGKIDDEGHMYLVAVSVVNCTGGKQDFNASRDCYVIRSDYTGAQTYQASSASPWVDVNPLSKLNDKVSGISPVTGDGAAFMADGKTPIGTQIAADGKFYNVSEAMAFFNGTNVSGISLAPFSTAGGNTGTGMPDFPVLLLPAVSKAEVNTAVYNYISLLTNYTSSATTLNGKLKGNITANTYHWNGTQFEPIVDSSITVNNGAIYATPGKYDNTLDQFTLLTVTYQDPTDATNSYKLYIPIVVQKLLRYHFYASAISGTLYSRETYLGMTSPVVTTHGDQITVLLSYVYDNEKTGDAAIAEWQNSVDNGDNLLWNFDKTIVLTLDGNEGLPAHTKLTLVDRNNQDKVYYAIYDGSVSTDGKAYISLSSFKAADNTPYVKNALCDAMGLKAAEADGGTFVATTKEDTAATVRVGDTYYRPATDTDTGAKFNITVGNAKLLEEYYLTIQTPANSLQFSNVKIECERGLTNNTGDKTMLPNKFIEEDSQHPFTRNASENRILFGDFFKQTVSVSTTTAEEISDANNTIDATLKVTIDYKDETWRSRFTPYADAIKLYQRFELQARDWTNGNAASTSFTDRTATIRYFNGETQVGSTETKGLGAEGIMVLEFPSNATGGVTVSTTTELNAATLVAKVKLSYTTSQIQSQFHTRSDTTDGLQLWATSHLALSKAALERGNNPSRGEDTQHFYRKEIIPVTLVYNASGTDVDARVNQLGINGRVETAAAIDSVATYNVSVLDAAKYANTIHYAITLYRKDDSGNFVKVDADKLLTVGALKATLTDRNGNEKTVNFGETFAGGIDITIPIRISLPLTVATGSGFTGTYANYKVELKVWLQNGNAQISGSEAQDYIIYTNAKIKFPLVTNN